MTCTTCSACGSHRLQPVLDLGTTPLANALLTEAELDRPEDRFPLVMVLCADCALFQITERVPPEHMFREYLYFSSFSDTMQRHAADAASKLIRDRNLGADSLVVEIASNDGYLLRNFVSAGVPVLGIEPARNIAKVARERGVDTIEEFFGGDLALRLACGDSIAGRSRPARKADVILANNVMAHVPDINGVIDGIAALLKPGGIFVTESPYLKPLLDHLEFDTVYHEHLFYYSLTALVSLYARRGLQVVDVERLEIHGGSIRVTVAHPGTPPSAAVAAMLAEEDAWGVRDVEVYRARGARFTQLQASLKELLLDLKRQGKRIAAYGAAAKGATLLNSSGIGPDLLDFVVDRSTYKQGRYMPGVRLPVLPPEALLTSRPDYVLLLTWNFATEILEQQGAYRAAGGKFIVPVPEPRVV
ncbi:MAG: class I SAM-dependent methyltransferase [Myxococcales bacterium]|nr:class I SAM-dependent methyltransferase [Myxococcales bacterium]